MNKQDQLNLSLQTACLIQQNQMLKRQNAMLLELLDGMESVGEDRKSTRLNSSH